MSRRVVALLALGPLAFLAIFFVWPVVAILGRGLAPGGHLDLDPVGSVVTDPSLRHVLLFTVGQALLSTILTLAVGLPAAAALGRYRLPGRSALTGLLTVPFVLPTIVVATAFDALGVRRSLVAILLAHCFFNVAVVVRVVGAAFETLDPGREEVARVLGASRRRVLATVTWPEIRPAVAAASAVVFLFCFTSFGVILVLGGPSYATLETEIYRQTSTLLDLGTAAALSVVQLLVVIVALLVAGRFGRAVAAPGRASRLRPVRGPRTAGALAVALAPAVVLVLTPVGELVRRALAHDAYGFRRLDTPIPGLEVTPLRVVATSLGIAATAALLATALGLALATAVTRGRGGTTRATEALVAVPLGISAVTVGFGFLITFDTPPVDLRTSWWIVPIAHTIVALPFVTRVAVPVLRTVGTAPREVAATLGASPARVWWTVDGPAVGRAAAIGAAFAFAISLGEFGATLFVVRPETTTVPVAVYRLLGRPGATNQDVAMALATLLMALTGGAVLLADHVRTRWSSPA